MIDNGYTLTDDFFVYKDPTGRRIHLNDLKNENLGLDENGNLMGFDIDIF